MRRTHASALVAVLAILAASPADAEAPQTKRCIASAEQGQQLRRDGKLVSARATFMICAASDCPTVVRRDCGRWIDDLDATIPTVVVKLQDEEGKDATEARVLLDGETLSGATSGRAFPLDPGTHRIAWMRPAGDLDAEIVVREGERNRVVVLRAKPSRPGSADAPPPPATPAPNDRARSSVPWILGGVGVGLAATGGVLWGVGLSERSGLQGTCAAAHVCSDSDVSASRTKLVVGDVLVGVGIVGIAAAVYFFVRRDEPASAAASR